MSTLWRALSTTRAAGAGRADAAARAVVAPKRLTTETATTAARVDLRSPCDFGHSWETESNSDRAFSKPWSSWGDPGAVAAASRSASLPSTRFGNSTTPSALMPGSSNNGPELTSTM
jgi:hypothetical protein